MMPLRPFLLRRTCRSVWSRAWRATRVAALANIATACGWLDVTDPTLVQDSSIATPAGANARRLSVVYRIDQHYGWLAHNVALFTDERTLATQIPTARDIQDFLDARDGDQYQARSGKDNDVHLGRLDEIVATTSLAIPAVRSYTPDSLRGDFLAQLFALRGFAIVQMAEDVCPGFPINDVDKDNLPLYSGPYTTDSALTYGLSQLDSALVHGRDSARFVDLTRVVKGRALLDLGRYAAAGSTVAAVPTAFTYSTDTVFNGGLYSGQNWGPYDLAEPVGNREGGTGLPFASAQDPRVPTVFKQTRYNDPTDSLYDQLKYDTPTRPVVMASGVEARLIEAEAALAAGNPTWFTILNTLRTTAITPAMPPIAAAPSTAAAQVDLLYSERAFWLYLTGRRLGDVRRLIRRYGRAGETVLPTGRYPLGGAYGTATAIPFVLGNQQQFNPHIVSGCATR